MYETLAWVVRTEPPNPEQIAALERSVVLYEKIDNSVALARVLYNLADVYRTKHQCGRALPYLRRAGKLIAGTAANVSFGAVIQAQTAGCLAQEKQWPEADAAYTSAIATLEKIGEPVPAARASQNFAELLDRRGQRARARQVAQQAVKLVADKPEAGTMRDELNALVKQLR
jgi:tetratricopeptide (TPR) repeat protein